MLKCLILTVACDELRFGVVFSLRAPSGRLDVVVFFSPQRQFIVQACTLRIKCTEIFETESAPRQELSDGMTLNYSIVYIIYFIRVFVPDGCRWDRGHFDVWEEHNLPGHFLTIGMPSGLS